MDAGWKVVRPRNVRRARSDWRTTGDRGERRGFQIGPKIRIGGTLGHIGQQAKLGLGKVEKAIAPAVAMIPGIGPLVAAGLNVNGNMLDTSNGGIHTIGDVGKIAGSTALDLLPAGLGKVGSLAQSIPGVQGIGNALGSIPGASQIGGALKSAAGSGIGQALSGLAGDAGSFLTGNGGMNALGVAQGINAARLQQKSNQYATNAMGDVNASYNERAPLRAQALNVLPSAIAANPFARGGTIKGSNGVAPQSITMANG